MSARPGVSAALWVISALAAAPGHAQEPELDALEARLIELEAEAEEAHRRAEAERLRAEAAAAEAARRAAQSPAFDLVGELIDIPAGEFRMGDLAGDDIPWEKPVRVVRVRAFRLARHEVTVGQFRRFVNATGYTTDAERDPAISGCWAAAAKDWTGPRGAEGYQSGLSWRDPGFAQTDRHPVVCVSWNDAVAYLDWVNRETGLRFRLPSEAEWEYAARAGGRSRFPWGETVTGACRYANVSDYTPGPGAWEHLGRIDCNDEHFFTAPVGSYRANPWGLDDMIGNVSEWIADCWNDTYDGAPTDGSARRVGDCSRRGSRGGSWNEAEWGVRSAGRSQSDAWGRSSDRGFRVALDAPR